MIIRCEVYVSSKFFDLCGEPAVALARAGCIHEHIVDRPVCEQHRQIAGATGCMRCLTDDQAPHVCPMTGQLLPLPAVIA
jgi:hypothetical protein